MILILEKKFKGLPWKNFYDVDVDDNKGEALRIYLERLRLKIKIQKFEKFKKSNKFYETYHPSDISFHSFPNIKMKIIKNVYFIAKRISFKNIKTKRLRMS